MTSQYMGNPLSTQYMESVVELRPTKSAIKESYIGLNYLPYGNIDDYVVTWDATRFENPIAGFYALEDRPTPGQDLDFETFKSDVMHVAAMRTLTAKEIQGLREAGESHIRYGTGFGAEYMRKKDARKMAELTNWCNDTLDTLVEYLAIHSLLGRIEWPPRDENGAVIAPAQVPVHWGDIKVDFPIPFLAADAVTGLGGFHQQATTLASGIANGLAAAGAAWNNAASNMLQDMEVITQLMLERQGLGPTNMEMICSRGLLSNQSFNNNVLNAVLGTQRSKEFLNVSEIKDYITTRFGWSWRTYDAQWTYVRQGDYGSDNPTVRRVRFMPNDTVLIVARPEISEMGIMATAPAPGPAHQWRQGKYFWMDRNEKPPWDAEMGMGMYVWPLVFQIDARFRLDAYD